MSHQKQRLGPVMFPSPTLPADLKEQKLLGIYAQRDMDLFMLRVKAPGGRIATDQWRRLARLAATFTPDYPLHLTTRQDIELHGVPPDAVVKVLEGVAEAGLTTIGACGDTPRNITLCPGGGMCVGHGDLLPLLLAVKTYLEGLPDIHALPRKFKISFSGCREACAQPWINDLGFVRMAGPLTPPTSVLARPGPCEFPGLTPAIDLRRRGEAASLGPPIFDVIGAGSLGFKPGTGVLLAREVGLSDVFACVLAAIRIFQRHGDREHRMRARLRHVRERLGNEAFQQLFDAELRQARKEGGFPEVRLPPAPASSIQIARLSLVKGDLTPAQAERLADLCDAHAAWSNLDNQQGVRIFGASAEPLREAIEHDGLLAGLLEPLSIVTCPGVTWCSKGIADTRAMAERLREVLSQSRAGRAVVVCISGCPNGCAQSGVAPIGLAGFTRTVGGVRTECFRMVARGGLGKSPVLAREVAAAPSAEVPRLVAQLLENWDSFIAI